MHYAEPEDVLAKQVDESCTHHQRGEVQEKLCNTQNARITRSIKSTKAARTSNVDREDVQDDQVDESRTHQQCTTQQLNNIVF